MTSLVLGSFNMLAGTSVGSTRVMSEGTSRGNPVPIEVAVKSWLQDGSIVVTQGYDNREVRVRVRFLGDNLTDLAATEALLFAELGKPNTLTWTPPNGPASVFDVITSSLDYEDDDAAEAQGDPWRTYTVRLVCAAFVRSAAEVTAAALAASGSTTTLVNDGSATTNWTGAVSAGTLTGPTVVSGAVKVGTTAAVSGLVTVTATLTTSITTSSTKYLVVDWKPESTTGKPGLRAYGDGLELTVAAQTVSPTAGFTRTWFGPVAASSIAALRLDSTSDISDYRVYRGEPAIRSLYVDNINRTDIKPTIGTTRQLLRSIDVSGSAPTQGTLAVEQAVNALGDVLVYTFPDRPDVLGYSPPLRQYRVSGPTVTADATLVSGSYENLSTGTTTYDIPVRNLAPGLHLLMVRTQLAGSPPWQMAWTVSTRINATTVGSTSSGTTTTSTGGSFLLWAITRVMIPTTDVDSMASTGVVRVTLTVTGGTSALLDEAWLFNMDIGQLIQVACGSGSPASGGPAKRLFIEPATTLRPRPTIRIGDASDRSDAYYPAGTALASWQFPEFTPPRVNIFTVATNATDASVTLRHYPRWHTNAAS